MIIHMNFSCKQCDYVSPIKSNYNRHMKTLSHYDYECCCGKSFKSKSGLLRHEKKYDCPNRVDSDTIKLLKNQNDDLVKLLFEYVKNTKGPQIINNGTINTNYNISVKNYVQKTYTKAPLLCDMEDYKQLKYYGKPVKTQQQNKLIRKRKKISESDEFNDNGELRVISDDNETDESESGEETNEYINQDDKEFIDTLLYKSKHCGLNSYLGDFIVSRYKKDDPAQQSMWTSDVARLTYVVKELLGKDESIWNHDYKGVKIKNRVIVPLLDFVKESIIEYCVIDSQLTKPVNISITENIGRHNKLLIIRQTIDSGTLANEIVRYIAPYFCIDTNSIE